MISLYKTPLRFFSVISHIYVIVLLIVCCRTYSMEEPAENNVIPSLRTIALSNITQMLNKPGMIDDRKYVKLAKQIRKSFIPDEISVDLVSALIKTQDSLAPETTIHLKASHFKSMQLKFDTSNNYLLVHSPKKTIRIYDAANGKKRGKFVAKGRIYDYKWHPSRSELALVTQHEIVCLDSNAQVVKRKSYNCSDPSKRIRIQWSANGSHIIVYTFCNGIALEYATQKLVTDRSIICDACRIDKLEIKYSPNFYQKHFVDNHTCSRSNSTQPYNDTRLFSISVKDYVKNHSVSFENKKTKERYEFRTNGKIQSYCYWDLNKRFCAWLTIHAKGKYFKVHLFDMHTLLYTHVKIMPRELVTSLCWSTTDDTFFVYNQWADIYRFEAPSLNQLFHHEQYVDRTRMYQAPSDMLIIVPGDDDQINHFIKLFDLRILNKDNLSAHDRLMGILALTNRYKELKKKYRSQIGFEKDIDDTTLAKKVRASLNVLDT